MSEAQHSGESKAGDNGSVVPVRDWLDLDHTTPLEVVVDALSESEAPPCVWPHDRHHVWTSAGPLGPDRECDRGCRLRYGDWLRSTRTFDDMDSAVNGWPRFRLFSLRLFRTRGDKP